MSTFLPIYCDDYPSVQSNVCLAEAFLDLARSAILLLSAGIIAQNRSGWFSPSSMVFLISLFGIVVARWMDPTTGIGEPSTPAHVRRFAVTVILGGLTAWVSVNVLANYWFQPGNES